MIVVAEVAHWMALIPAAFLAVRVGRGARLSVEWPIMAAAFAVSALADSAAHWVDPWVVSLIYPVSQTLLIAAVVLPRRDTIWFAGACALAGIASILWRGIAGPDVLLRSVAWLGLSGMLLNRWSLGRLRTALLVYFGVGFAAWFARSLWPILPWWYIGQTVRLAGLLLFCRAMTVTRPALSVVRGMARA